MKKILLRAVVIAAVLVPSVPLALVNASGIANAAQPPAAGCFCPVPTQGFTGTLDFSGVNCTGLPSDCYKQPKYY